MPGLQRERCVPAERRSGAGSEGGFSLQRGGAIIMALVQCLGCSVAAFLLRVAAAQEDGGAD